MVRKKIQFLLFVLVLSGVLLSCAKSKENKLIGIWKLIDYNNLQSTDTITWEFKADGTLWIKNVNDTTYLDTANYEFQTHSMRYYVQIVGYGTSQTDDDWDGLYHIDKLTKEILILQCQDPFFHWEFTKE